MNETNGLNELIEAFSSYRSVLTPLQQNLNDIVTGYDSMKEDLLKLDKAFSGETKERLDKIYSTLNAQAKSSQELAQKIDRFSASGEKYEQAVSEMTGKFSAIEKRLAFIDELEKRAEEQLKRLDEIANEKKIGYNVKDLQKTLDAYNKNVEKVSDFINFDIANVLQENGKKIDEIKKEHALLSEAVAEQSKTVENLLLAFRETSALLKQSVEKEQVNEEYLFSVLDKWANARKVKTKKK